MEEILFNKMYKKYKWNVNPSLSADDVMTLYIKNPETSMDTLL